VRALKPANSRSFPSVRPLTSSTVTPVSGSMNVDILNDS
jgi:hypothetical protein